MLLKKEEWATIRKSIQWLWRASHGVRLRLLIGSTIGILHVAAGLLFIFISKRVVDTAAHQMNGSKEDLFLNAALLGILMLGEVLLGVTASWMNTQNDLRMNNRVRLGIFSRLFAGQWNGKERFHTGDTLNRLEEDVQTVTTTVCETFPDVVVTLVQLLAAFYFLFCMDATLALVTVAIMPVFLLLSKIYMVRLRQMTKEIRNTDSKLESVLQESLQHRVLIQSMEHSRKTTQQVDTWQQKLYRQVMARTRFSLFSRSMITIGFAAGYLVAFLWGALQLHQHAITFGVMTAFLQLVNRIQRPTVDLTKQIPSLVHASTSVDRLVELEDIPLEEQGEPRMLEGTAGVRLHNVTFRYPDGARDIVHELSYDFPPGSRTAIVGETGTGKSTLIRLLLAILRPQSGEIQLYTDVSLKATALTRCNLVYVPQGNTLLSGTIRDNLKMGNEYATDQEMQEALHTAAADFVLELPEGLDTECGERGTGLSEGQAQRIAIARGLLRPGSILLLDELTSSLDAETERTLLERLCTTRHGKTMIFITHREIIKEYCDRILRL
jgi:ABC-type multidrug transport system fused ATPase/permease subunit